MTWLIITIIVCTFFIVKVIKEQSPIAQVKKTHEAIKIAEEKVKYWHEHIMHKEPGLIDGTTLDELRANLIKMEDNYSRLKKKTDPKEILELATDLQNYAEALFHLKMAWCVLETDLSDDAVDNYGIQVDEHQPIKIELETKFANLLKD
jgi:hypothetical protein